MLPHSRSLDTRVHVLGNNKTSFMLDYIGVVFNFCRLISLGRVKSFQEKAYVIPQ